jgi:hypothetical protein
MKQEQFKITNDIVALIFAVHKWGNKAVGDKREITTEADKAMLALQKKLLNSPEYKAISDYLQETKEWVMWRSVPSFFRKGTFLVKLGMVEAIEDELAARKALLNILVDKFLQTYPQQVTEAKLKLGPQFRERDYPDTEEMKYRFYWDTQWISFIVPDDLPERIKQQEIVKAQNMWEDAAQAVTYALRESFRELVAHAAERLAPGEDGKRKKLYDSTIENVSLFLDTFAARNPTNDEELATLVERAKKVLVGADIKVIKDNAAIRDSLQGEFAKLTAEADKLVETKPNRRFFLDD